MVISLGGLMNDECLAAAVVVITAYEDREF
jgi:hypothetical protein